MHAMRTDVHTMLGSNPGSLVFNRDRFLNIPPITDWHTITQKREHLVNENLIRENNKQRQYNYVQNQWVLKIRHKSCKLGHRPAGPYKVLQTHVNGMLTIELKPGISERINIHRVIPYKE